MTAIDLTESPSSRLLHNMSARPRTAVTRTVAPTRGDWAAFKWSAAPPTLDPHQRRALDVWWERFALRGAALVYARSGMATSTVRVTVCRNDELTLNVLLRSRGSLLIAEMPLLDHPDALRGIELLTDDLRLMKAVLQ
ncbi:MAG: hypothetical protein ABI658_32720 [Acidimicrobiales bacterium]